MAKQVEYEIDLIQLQGRFPLFQLPHEPQAHARFSSHVGLGKPKHFPPLFYELCNAFSHVNSKMSVGAALTVLVPERV